MSHLSKNNIKKIILVVLDLPENEVSDGFSMNTCEKWDSLAHIKIVMVLESEFNIKLKDDEIGSLIDIQSIYKLVSKLISIKR